MITYEYQLTLSVKVVASGRVRLRIGISGHAPCFVVCTHNQSYLLRQQLNRAYELVRSQGGEITPDGLRALVTRANAPDGLIGRIFKTK